MPDNNNRANELNFQNNNDLREIRNIDFMMRLYDSLLKIIVINSRFKRGNFTQNFIRKTLLVSFKTPTQ